MHKKVHFAGHVFSHFFAVDGGETSLLPIFPFSIILFGIIIITVKK
jgi:hypothetical protein